MSIYILPAIFICLFGYCYYKKVNVYQTFIDGAKKSVPLVISILPFITVIFIAVSLLRVSGITDFFANIFSPIFAVLGIPKELVSLVFLRPFTGSGSFALLNDVFLQYGADSYISRCACVILGCSETIFYVATVYTAQTKIKKLYYAIPVALVASLFGSVLACLLCKIM